MALSDKIRVDLMTVSTATFCTALFKLGFHNQFIQDVLPVKPKTHNMVRPAYTLRYIPAARA